MIPDRLLFNCPNAFLSHLLLSEKKKNLNLLCPLLFYIFASFLSLTFFDYFFCSFSDFKSLVSNPKRFKSHFWLSFREQCLNSKCQQQHTITGLQDWYSNQLNRNRNRNFSLIASGCMNSQANTSASTTI